MKHPEIYILIIFFIFLSSCGIKRSLNDRPDLTGIDNIATIRVQHNDSTFTLGNNSLVKNKFGIWELYVEGDALERGLVTGSLTRELMHKQERSIMEKIESLVPSGGYQNFLRKAVIFFNRKMHLHIPEEYKAEIYGISRYALAEYNSFAPAYVRSLYLHGAHDIGHALQDLMLVGCTSFAAWDTKTKDGQLLIGRNFDFYAGDEFAEEKIVAFVNPDKGQKFMMYTWGGMIGVVSGMNDKGITVTINAGKSKIPLVAKTPISLVAREILQYSKTTEEAIAIAKKREVFVSEAIMVGSASEKKAIIIEVAPGNLGVYEVKNSNQLVCSNHFQSEAFEDDKRNISTRENSHSNYRYELMQDLITKKEALNPEKAAEILRYKDGIDGVKLGLGNEKAINQLLAHHGVIFKPEELKVWISANPYQMGTFVAYDLRQIFDKFISGNIRKSVASEEENIPADDFIETASFQNYLEYRRLSGEIANDISEGGRNRINANDVEKVVSLNPYYWKAYSQVGKYYYENENYKKAVIYFKQAQRREVTTKPDEEWLEKMIRKSYRKI